ncbi:MAG TPA: type III-A CRISPR-associated RAMP protein Csm5 [Xanthomonadaceae bacterium]|nr:type III-A CRISPR-associated RAMP protein Csm5 [Xanthomonadaceae bacterium]
MTVYRFRATPLTPIHVGDGSTLAPEDYLIEGDHLIQFNRAATLRDMQPETRRQLEERLERNDFQAAQEILRKSVQPRHHRCRIQIGAESKADLLKAVGNPLDPVVRQRTVNGFVRNPLTGQPYLPGSVLKGAIRTAVVNSFTQKHLASIKPLISPLLENSSQRRNAWKTLETEALNFEFRRLQEDPFRLLKVADAELPPDRTRVDKVWPVKRDGKEDTKGIQMHFERLLSRGDGIEDGEFTVELELDELAAGDARVHVGRRLDFETIRLACISFYAGRILAEQRRFFAEAQPPESIFGAQGLIKINPDKVLVAKSIQERGLLLRVGRFSHFESLSVDHLRQGWNAQKKQPFKPGEEGSSRTLCRCRPTVEGTSLALPFGWLLLELEGRS